MICVPRHVRGRVGCAPPSPAVHIPFTEGVSRFARPWSGRAAPPVRPRSHPGSPSWMLGLHEHPVGCARVFIVRPAGQAGRHPGRLAQLARARRSHRRGHWFESSIAHSGSRSAPFPRSRPFSLGFRPARRTPCRRDRPRTACAGARDGRRARVRQRFLSRVRTSVGAERFGLYPGEVRNTPPGKPEAVRGPLGADAFRKHAARIPGSPIRGLRCPSSQGRITCAGRASPAACGPPPVRPSWRGAPTGARGAGALAPTRIRWRGSPGRERCPPHRVPASRT